MPGVLPMGFSRGKIRIRLVPPFPNYRHTRKSDFPSQSYGCLKFFQKTMMLLCKNTDNTPMLYAWLNNGRSAPMFHYQNIDDALMLSKRSKLYYCQNIDDVKNIDDVINLFKDFVDVFHELWLFII